MSIARFNFWQTNQGIPVQTILQVARTYYDVPTSQAISAATDTPITGLSVNITPRTINSRFFLFARWFGEYTGSAPHDHLYYFKRGSTIINIPTGSIGSRTAGMATYGTNYQAAGEYNNDSTPETLSMFTIDSPASTSQITYTVSCKYNNAGTLYTNRTVGDQDASYTERGTSEIIVMEIAV